MTTLGIIYGGLLTGSLTIQAITPLITKRYKDEIKGNKIGLRLSIVSIALALGSFSIGIYWILT